MAEPEITKWQFNPEIQIPDFSKPDRKFRKLLKHSSGEIVGTWPQPLEFSPATMAYLAEQVCDTDMRFASDAHPPAECLCSRCGKPITDSLLRVDAYIEDPDEERPFLRYHALCLIPPPIEPSFVRVPSNPDGFR